MSQSNRSRGQTLFERERDMERNTGKGRDSGKERTEIIVGVEN